jgi:hypothetical protein
MHRVRGMLLVLTMLGVLAGGASSAAAAKPKPTLAKLQLAAGDLARETANRDRPGSKRALAEFKDVYGGSQGRLLRSKAPTQAKAVKRELAETGRFVTAGKLTKAGQAAGALLKAVNAAALIVRPNGSAKGVVGLLTSLKSAARDIDQEAEFKDRTGSQRAVQSFEKVFQSSREQLQAKVPATVTKVTDRLKPVQGHLRTHDYKALRRDARSLLSALDAGIKTAKKHAA